MPEIWKKIDGYEHYAISNFGNVKRLPKKIGTKNGGFYICKEKLLKTSVWTYPIITLTKNRKSKTFYVHHLMVLAFWGITVEKYKTCVNHKNGIKTDNRLENLEVIRHGENTRHAYDMGLNVNFEGQHNPRSKLSPDQVREIRKRAESGEPYPKLGKEFGVDRNTICSIKTRKTWRHLDD